MELKKAEEYDYRNENLILKHYEEALKKLKTAVQLIEEQSSKEDYHAQHNFIKLSIWLSRAHAILGDYWDALHVIGKASRVVKKLKDTKELKFSKNLIFMAAEAAAVSGYLNNNLNNNVSAERCYR